MLLSALTLKNYRSYTEDSFEFGTGVNIVIGPNASGKTNLLEAVYVLNQGSSFRGSDKDLLREGSEWARIDGVLTNQERSVRFEKGSIKTRKTFEINNTKKSRLAYDMTLPTVLFDPEDIRMIHGSPERRRVFLDHLLSATSPHYKQALLKYNKTLKQRNTLLKTPNLHPEKLFAWDIIIARYAEILTKERANMATIIDTTISHSYSAIADSQQRVNVSYISDTPLLNYMSSLVKKLEQARKHDIERGYTSFGPHRDDIVFSLNNTPAAVTASRGECRTLSLAIKTIEVELVAKARNQQPILLLDDVFSELDGTRRKKLTEFLKDQQSIITTTDADVVGKKFASLAQLITM